MELCSYSFCRDRKSRGYLILIPKDGEELLAGIAPERMDLRLKQSAKLNELRKRLEDFKADVFRLHELFTRIPINTERLRLAKEHFDKGEFREADAVLKAEEINADVAQHKARRAAALETVAAEDQNLAELANEFLLKGQLALVSPVPEGGSRFKQAEQWFEQALAAARTAEVLFEYTLFLKEHNAFRRAEPLCQEALKQYRSLAAANPEAFLPRVAGTLNNLAVLHRQTNAFGPALDAYEEALQIFRSLAEVSQEAFLPRVAVTLNNLAMLHSDQNAFGPALEEYEEALKIRRSLAEASPEAFLPDVAETLINLSIFYLYSVPDTAKSVAYAEKARSILIPLCAQAPHLQQYLDKAEQVLKLLMQKFPKQEEALLRDGEHRSAGDAP
jgi:tetratricopeptide (TPR) repeat protein